MRATWICIAYQTEWDKHYCLQNFIVEKCLSLALDLVSLRLATNGAKFYFRTCFVHNSTERRESQRSKLGAFKECIKIYYKLSIYKIYRIKTPTQKNTELLLLILWCSKYLQVLSTDLILQFWVSPSIWPLLLPITKVISLPWQNTKMYIKI